MANKSKKSLVVPVNFLFNSSPTSLSSYELAKLSEIANLRGLMLDTLEQLVEASALASIAVWFRQLDRAELLRAIDVAEDPIEFAKRQIREMRPKELETDSYGRSLPEPKPDESIEMMKLLPGVAHRAAAINYAERHIDQGLCATCPRPLARNSVRFCEVHLAKAREYQRGRERERQKTKVAAGLCALCTSPLAKNSKSRCEAHLKAHRERQRKSTRWPVVDEPSTGGTE